MSVKNEIANVLLEACDVLRSGWCQGATAKDSQGNPVLSDSDQAVTWCVQGAIIKVVKQRIAEIEKTGKKFFYPCSLQSGLYHELLDDLADIKGSESSIHWNDNPARTQEEAIKFLIEAIKFNKERPMFCSVCEELDDGDQACVILEEVSK